MTVHEVTLGGEVSQTSQRQSLVESSPHAQASYPHALVAWQSWQSIRGWSPGQHLHGMALSVLLLPRPSARRLSSWEFPCCHKILAPVTLSWLLLQAVEAGRRWAIHQMTSCLALPSANASLKLGVARFLALHAYFDVDKTSSIKVRVQCCCAA